MNEYALAELLIRYVRREISTLSFIEQYQCAWRKWRDAGQPGSSVDIFDKAFTAADCYSPDPKARLEISAEQLHAEMAELVYRLPERFRLGEQSRASD